MTACDCPAVGVPHVHVGGSDGSLWVVFEPVSAVGLGCGGVGLGQGHGVLEHPVTPDRTPSQTREGGLE